MAEKYNEPNSPKEKQFDDKKKQGGQTGQPGNPDIGKKEFQGGKQGQGDKDRDLQGQQGGNVPRETKGSNPTGGKEKSYGEPGMEETGSDVTRESSSGGDDKKLNA